MTVMAADRAKSGYALAHDEGEAFWILGMLETVKIGRADTATDPAKLSLRRSRTCPSCRSPAAPESVGRPRRRSLRACGAPRSGGFRPGILGRAAEPRLARG